MQLLLKTHCKDKLCQAQGSLTPSLTVLCHTGQRFYSVKTHSDQRSYKPELCVTLHVNTSAVRKSGNALRHTSQSSHRSRWQGESCLEFALLGSPEAFFSVVTSENNLSYLRWDSRPSQTQDLDFYGFFLVDMITSHLPSRVPWLSFMNH